MNRFKSATLLFSTCLLVLLPAGAAAQEDKSLPRFQDYLVTRILHHKPVAADLRSDRQARLFRTQLRQGVARKGVNFAGQFTLLTWGCGSDCRMVAVVDAKTGDVYIAPFTVSTGISFHLESKLVIANASEINRYLSGEPMLDVYWPAWYVWQHGRFVRVFRKQAESLRRKRLG